MKRFCLLTLMFFSLISFAFASGNSEAVNDGAQPEKVIVWTWKTNKTWDSTIAAFEAKYPEVEVEHIPYNFPEYEVLLKTAYVAGEYPDVIGLKPGAQMKMYQGILEDLEPWCEKEWGASWKDRYVQAGLDFCYVSSNGEGLYGLPHSLEITCPWYSVPVFEELGLEVPTNYDELVSVSKTLKNAGYAPFLVGAKDKWPNKDIYMIICNDVAPGKFIKAEAGEIPWTDSDLVKAMELWKSLFDDGVVAEGAFGMTHYMDAVDIMGEGHAGMIQMGSWHTNYAYPQTRFDSYVVDQRPFPFPDVSGDGEPAPITGSADLVLCMTNGSKVKDGAWKFIKWMTSEEGATEYPLETSIRPVPNATAPDYFEDWQIEDWNNMHEWFANSSMRNILYPELDSALGEMLAAVITGGLSPYEAMAVLEKVSVKVKR